MKTTDDYRIKLVVKPSNDSITLDEIYKVFSKFGNLLDMKDGSGKLAYDGHGFDLDTNAYEFFFYFKENAHGLRQLRAAHSLLVKAAKKIEAKKCKVSLLADEKTSSALSHNLKSATRSNGTDSIKETLNLVEQSIQSAITNVDEALTILEESQEPKSAIGGLDTSIDALVNACNSAIDTFREITPQIDDSPIYQQLQFVKSMIKNSEDIANTIQITNFDDESFPYQVIARLSNFPILLRLFRLFYTSCKENKRPLTKDERALLDFALLMCNLNRTGGGYYQLIDLSPNEIWIPRNFDNINKGSFVETPLMPYILENGKVIAQRGLAILKTRIS